MNRSRCAASLLYPPVKKSAAVLTSWFMVVDIAKGSVKVGEGGEGSWVKVENIQGRCQS